MAGFPAASMLFTLLEIEVHGLRLLISDFCKTPYESAVSFNDLVEHALRPYPYASFSIHGLIYDDVLKRFGMLGYMENFVDVPLEVSVVFSHTAKIGIITLIASVSSDDSL